MKKIDGNPGIKPTTDLDSYWGAIQVPSELSIDPMPLLGSRIDNFAPIGPYFWYVLNLSDFTFAGLGGDIENMLGVSYEDLWKQGGYAKSEFTFEEDLGYNVAYTKFCWDLITSTNPEERKNLICTYTVRTKNKKTSEIKWVLVQIVDWIVGTDNRMYYVLNYVTDISMLGLQEKVRLVIYDTSNDTRTVYYSHTPSKEIPEKKPAVKFSPRQKEIIKLIAQGYGSKQIADRLCLSPHTVNNHRSKILKMAEVPNSAALLVFAARNGIL